MRGPCLQRMRLVERIIGQRAEEAEALSYSKLERQVAYYAGFLSSYHGYEVKVKITKRILVPLLVRLSPMNPAYTSG